MKKCSGCKTIKEDCEFHRGTTYCKPCRKQYRIAHSNFDRDQGYNLRKNYGISVEEFDALAESQNNMCAICGVGIPHGRGNWHVDHDHKTGKIRGLLCHHCNVGLGYFKDSMDNLNNAILYLAGQ